MEWYGTNRISRKLAEEISADYQGTHVLCYDEDVELGVLFQPNNGFKITYKGSRIEITPDNNITIHYGQENSGVQIQLSDGRVDVQANSQINITSNNDVNIDAKNVVIRGTSGVQIKGDHPGQHAVNAEDLFVLLSMMASAIDAKTPSSAGMITQMVNGMKPSVINKNISYI